MERLFSQTDFFPATLRLSMARSITLMKKKSYTLYSDAYRQEALALADRIGVAEAARELCIHAYKCCSKAQRQQDISERK